MEINKTQKQEKEDDNKNTQSEKSPVLQSKTYNADSKNQS